MDAATNVISGEARSQLEAQVRGFNRGINQGREVSQDLNKDDFLKILLTQLTHQDPTSPLEDKEFVAQMAQFSSLEQMTNMASSFAEMTNTLLTGQAMGVIGRTVEVAVGDEVVRGTASGITAGSDPQVRVNGNYYSYNDILSVQE